MGAHMHPPTGFVALARCTWELLCGMHGQQQLKNAGVHTARKLRGCAGEHMHSAIKGAKQVKNYVHILTLSDVGVPDLRRTCFAAHHR